MEDNNHHDICFKCYKNGYNCCKDVAIGILYDEPAYDHFIKMYEEKSMPKGHEFNQRLNGKDRKGKDIWDEDVAIYESNNGFCMFFDKDTGKCTIYDNRPMICKVFPNVWQNQHTIFIALSCPLSHVIPLKVISDMTKPYKEEIAKIPYYNTGKKEPRYLNLRKLYTDYSDKLSIILDIDEKDD